MQRHRTGLKSRYSFIAFSSTRKVALCSAATNGSNRTIWKMTATGEIVAQMTGTSTSTANDSHPSWADSNVMYYESDRGGAENTWFIDPTIPVNRSTPAILNTGMPGMSSIDVEPGPDQPFGIDVGYSASIIPPDSWQSLQSESGQLPIGIVVVDLYGGVDGVNAKNPGCMPTWQSPGTSIDYNCVVALTLTILSTRRPS